MIRFRRMVIHAIHMTTLSIMQSNSKQSPFRAS